jgi:hypothetical protein
MIHTLNKGTLVLSHWISDSRFNWMKHRLHDYREPIDTIRIIKEFRKFTLVWKVYFNGSKIQHIEYMYRKIYGDPDIEEDQIELVKRQIDNLILKADKLILFT